MTDADVPNESGPADNRATRAPTRTTTLVELSHVIEAGMITLPNLPGPEITEHLSRTEARSVYAPGTTFEIGRISMVANTGTYLDSPHHRFEEGPDLAGLKLAQLADLPAVVVDCGGPTTRAVTLSQLSSHDVRGRAVLLRTGDDVRFGTADYVVDASFLTGGGADWLVDNGAVLVGIDSANIDDFADLTRPAHTNLLRAGIAIVEHLTGLEHLPPTGARFTAVPPLVAGLGTFPVRAFASVPA